MELIWPSWTKPDPEAAKRPSLLPRPMSLERREGIFRLLKESRIFVEPGSMEARRIAEYLAVRMAAPGPALPISELRMIAPPVGTVSLQLDREMKDAGEEGYILEAKPESVTVRAAHSHGLFYGVQTLLQYYAGGEMPCTLISDRPRFPWRGFHLDCARHFMEKDFVKKVIDLLAFHKLNRLHWHLTEDQGWRIEIERYPKLTEISAWRDDGKGGRYGGFYSKADIREIVAYASERYVTIVPEIEMPGHTQGVLAAYPELSCTGGPFNVGTEWGVYKDVFCAGNDKVFEFLEGVLAEVLELFPGQWIHIGADECPKDRWNECPKCQARMKKEGLKDAFALQTWFVGRMAKWLRRRGKTVIAWDEILEGGAPPGTIVQAWRGHQHADRAARAGSDVIVSPYSHVYFDYDPKFFSTRRVLMFDPVPPGMPANLIKHVLGTEGLIWTEYTPQETVEQKVFPRLCALSEVAWSPANDRDWPEFQNRLTAHCHRLRAMGVDVGPEAGEETWLWP